MWFKEKNSSLSNHEKEQFLLNFIKEPSLHIVFKNEEKLKVLKKILLRLQIFLGFYKINRILPR